MKKLLYICRKKVFINRKLVLVMALLKEDVKNQKSPI